MNGFVQACTHIRMDNNWHGAGRATYRPSKVRVVKGYWPGDAFPDVEYQEFSL